MKFFICALASILAITVGTYIFQRFRPRSTDSQDIHIRVVNHENVVITVPDNLDANIVLDSGMTSQGTNDTLNRQFITTIYTDIKSVMSPGTILSTYVDSMNINNKKSQEVKGTDKYVDSVRDILFKEWERYNDSATKYDKIYDDSVRDEEYKFQPKQKKHSSHITKVKERVEPDPEEIYTHQDWKVTDTLYDGGLISDPVDTNDYRGGIHLAIKDTAYQLMLRYADSIDRFPLHGSVTDYKRYIDSTEKYYTIYWSSHPTKNK